MRSSLDAAVEVAGGPEGYAVRGVYEKTTDSLYEQLKGTSKVEWHSSGCGWMISRAASSTVTESARACRCYFSRLVQKTCET